MSEDTVDISARSLLYQVSCNVVDCSSSVRHAC